MTFVKLIEDLTLSFGEIQEGMLLIITYAQKNSQKMTKQRKHSCGKELKVESGTN